ncbi:hypothetical protein DTO96_102330 [Ephemeroptericola cinctiostellae]|uniref:Uncharacterized protein n=1 Tax=Ephemeroptericola cinctiostellae TaxID=2268024 RepID=A0A345DDY7_9BURK|nr:hypothetical protein [Ephemeroptericola cinctiostellae]AXF86575.1 hypothetical protein DTO96_102330 [Ephemeroptericola cinctiostellae]
MSQYFLNLWPVDARERVDSRRQLLLESIFAGLLVVLSITAISVWVTWRTTQVRAVNAELNQAQHLLQGKSEVGDVAGVHDAEVARLQNEWRAQRSGQLNWLVALAESSSSDVKFISVKQSNEKLTITGQASDPEVIKNAMNSFALKMSHYKLLKLTLLENKKAGQEAVKNKTGQSQWLFGAELGVPVSASATATEGLANGVVGGAGEVPAQPAPASKDAK